MAPHKRLVKSLIIVQCGHAFDERVHCTLPYTQQGFIFIFLWCQIIRNIDGGYGLEFQEKIDALPTTMCSPNILHNLPYRRVELIGLSRFGKVEDVTLQAITSIGEFFSGRIYAVFLGRRLSVFLQLVGFSLPPPMSYLGQASSLRDDLIKLIFMLRRLQKLRYCICEVMMACSMVRISPEPDKYLILLVISTLPVKYRPDLFQKIVRS